MFGSIAFPVHLEHLLKHLLVSFLVLVFISSAGYSMPQGARELLGRSVPVTRLVVTTGSNTSPMRGSGIWDELRIVIRDRQTWDSVWKRICRPDPFHDPYPSLLPLPEIDFSREMLVVVAMGQRPSGSYRIIVSSAHERDNRLDVEVENISPCGADYAIMTAPVDIVRLPKSDLPVTFREVEVKCK
jgi:hypothetical protein